MADDPLTQTTTRLHRRWLLKMTLGIVALIALGLWGLYDATIKYPERGARHAEYMEWQYLEAERANSSLSLAGEREPRVALERLQSQPPAYFASNPAEDAKLGWLASLRTIGRLDPAHTTYGVGDRPSASGRLRELENEWTTSGKSPKALAAFDLPLQWAICVGGFALAGWMAFLFGRVASKTYRWDPEAKALTLPSGARIAPSDIEDLDKRKWHKFLVTLKIAGGHPQFGGRDVRLDLYRYTPLEEWVLEMERVRFPDRQEAEAPDAGAGSASGADSEAADAGSGEPASAASEQSDGSGTQRTGGERTGDSA
jgi:hypothetical protein